MADVWMYQVNVNDSPDVTGFDVVARDGDIGKVDEASYEGGTGSIVVDTGFWIFGKRRMIPAGTIDHIDLEDRKVHLRLTKDQIKNAPDYDEAMERDAAFRRRHEDHYSLV